MVEVKATTDLKALGKSTLTQKKTKYCTNVKVSTAAVRVGYILKITHTAGLNGEEILYKLHRQYLDTFGRLHCEQKR